MSEAGQDWAALGAAAMKEAGNASFTTGGALLLWDRATERPGFADAGARALLGADAVSATFPGQTRLRLNLLADGLAPRDGIRMERLRLTAGFAATLITCGCKLLTLDGGAPVLALTVPAAELRRLGVTLPAAEATATVLETDAGGLAEETVAPAPAPADAPPAKPAPSLATPGPRAPVPAAPRRAIVRFLWTSDASGKLTSVSPDFAELAGPKAAAALPGSDWTGLIGHQLIDRDGGLAERLASVSTWSGHRVLWRTEAPGEGARVELSGVPVLDAARQFSGFRGFGLARLTERETFPEVEATTEIGAATESAPDSQPDAIEAEELPEPVEATAGIEARHDEALHDIAAVFEPENAVVHQDEETNETEASVAVFDDAASAEVDEDAEPVDAGEAEEVGAVDDDAPEIVATHNMADNDATALVTEASLPEPAAPEPSLPNPPAAAPERETPVPGANIVPLRNGHLTAVRPMLEPSKPNLSSAERNAFREIAKALGARIAGEDDIGPRLPPVAPLKLKELDGTQDAAAAAAVPKSATPPAITTVEPAAEAQATGEAARPRLPNSHADVLDRLPIAVLVNRGDVPLYANRTLLDLLDYADLDDLAAGGSVSRLIKGAARTDGGAMILIDRRNHLVSVDAVLSSVSWLGEPATLMAFRHPDGGGEVKVLTPQEAEDAELAAEFEAEDAESGARVEALRLDVDAREARISELVAMLDTATDGVVTVDERGRILSMNKTAEALFGYDQREVTGELFTLMFSAESHAPALDYLEGLKGGGVASVMNDGREIVGRVRQGGKIPLFMTMGQIAEGTERRFCAVLRDITAWKKTEGELVEARKAAERASAQKSDVLAKISHEIRTPLNAIIGFAEVMAEERFGPIANERYKEYLRDIHQSGGYVISLVNDLLDLAKIEAGKLDLDFISVNLNEIALSTVALLQPEANRGRVVLRSGLSPKLPPVVADQRSIKQIVINLLSNAVKFTDAGGQVIVSTALGDQGEAILRVRDTGIGMDDHEIALALEPFRQVPTTRRKGGTGLGLPLTKALVEANRAAMTITSVKKEGTLIEITFPPQRVLAG